MGIQFSSLINHLLRWKLSSANDSISKISELSFDNDRISNLPNCVLSHILSFLPTSDSILTSLLSRRWKNVCKYVTTLDFDCTIPPFCNELAHMIPESKGEIRFCSFVKRTMILYGNKSLQRLRAQCGEVSKLYDVNKWFEFAIMRGVRSLDFSIDTYVQTYLKVQLPNSIFNCNTLEELKLWNVVIVGNHSFCLPNLRTMDIQFVRFQEDNFFSELICSCTSLESLVFGKISKLRKLNIVSRTLRYLTAEYEKGELAIDAPALEYLDLWVFTRVNCKIKKLSSLNEACIHVEDYWDDDNDDSCVFDIVQVISDVKILTLTIRTDIHVPGYRFPIFPRLTVLNLKAFCCRWRLLFLKNSYKLIHVNILAFERYEYVYLSHEQSHEHCWKNPFVVPTCFISSLTSMTIDGYTNSKSELAMAKFTIEKARVMRRMKISAYQTHTVNTSLPKLLNFRRGSKQCEVYVEVRWKY